MDVDKFSLTIDFEDEIHCANLNGHFTSKLSNKSLNSVQEILSHTGPSTIFVVGDICKKYRSFLSELCSDGHEIGSHSMTHPLLTRLTRKNKIQEILDSKKIIEDILAVPVLGFRSPNFVYDKEVIELVQSSGYLYDSSKLDNSSLHARASKITKTLDFPQFVISGRWFPPGGGYIRFFPSSLSRVNLRINNMGVKQLYIHPWEFEPQTKNAHATTWVGGIKHSINTRYMKDKVLKVTYGLNSKTISSNIEL
jgi:hypothetical protein